MKKSKVLKVIVAILVSSIFLLVIHRNRIYMALATNSQEMPFLQQLLRIEEDSNYYKTKEQYIQMIEEYEKEIINRESDISQLQEEIKRLEEENQVLSVYKDQYEEFRQEKEEWDTEIALQNPDYFISYYENMYEQDARIIYEQLKQVQILTEEQKEYANTIAKMDEEMAARALEVLLDEDEELVKYIVEGMKDDKRANILNNMTSQNAASVIKLISPETR